MNKHVKIQLSHKLTRRRNFHVQDRTASSIKTVQKLRYFAYNASELFRLKAHSRWLANKDRNAAALADTLSIKDEAMRVELAVAFISVAVVRVFC